LTGPSSAGRRGAMRSLAFLAVLSLSPASPGAPRHRELAGQTRRSGRAGPDPGRPAASQAPGKAGLCPVAALLKTRWSRKRPRSRSRTWPVPQRSMPFSRPSTLPSVRAAIRPPARPIGPTGASRKPGQRRDPRAAPALLRLAAPPTGRPPRRRGGVGPRQGERGRPRAGARRRRHPPRRRCWSSAPSMPWEGSATQLRSRRSPAARDRAAKRLVPAGELVRAVPHRRARGRTAGEDRAGPGPRVSRWRRRTTCPPPEPTRGWRWCWEIWATRAPFPRWWRS